MKKITVLLLIYCLICVILNVSAHAYTNEEICDTIYVIEGGKKASVPYGILSVSCSSEKDCRQICLNTVRNNRVRYKEYGHKKYDTYLEFLGSRYCPEGKLCKNWLPNLLNRLEKMK